MLAEGVNVLLVLFNVCTAAHVTMIAVGIGIYSMNVYHPSYRDVPKVGLFLALIAVETFIINKLFNLIGLNPNYMYTLGPNGNAALSFFYNMACGSIGVTILKASISSPSTVPSSRVCTPSGTG